MVPYVELEGMATPEHTTLEKVLDAQHPTHIALCSAATGKYASNLCHIPEEGQCHADENEIHDCEKYGAVQWDVKEGSFALASPHGNKMISKRLLLLIVGNTEERIFK